MEDDGDLDKEYDEDLDEVFEDDDANSDIENEDEKEGAPNDDIVIWSHQVIDDYDNYDDDDDEDDYDMTPERQHGVDDEGAEDDLPNSLHLWFRFICLVWISPLFDKSKTDDVACIVW